jgi:hypothetical protein
MFKYQKKRCVIGQEIIKHTKIKILVSYKSLYIFKVYILLKKRPVKSRIVCSLNVRFDKEGLIIKPFLEKDKEKANIQIPVKNKGKAAN